MSFVHEIIAKKWVYSGGYLEQYPRIFFQFEEIVCLRDMALFQIALCCDNTDDVTDMSSLDEHQKTSMVEYVIRNFGVDS